MAVSVLSLLIQSAGFHRMLRQVGPNTPPLVRRGMLRTAACRVAASVLYVVLGVMALLQGAATPVLALVIFTAVQVLWQANAVADIRLRRRLDGPPRAGRHRRSRSRL